MTILAPPPRRPLRAALLSLVALLTLAAPAALRAEPDPSPTPTASPTPTPPAEEAPPPREGAPQEGAPAAPPEAPRARLERLLRETRVHFEFKRAPLGDILQALAKASEVPIVLGRRAQAVLERRKFLIKYIADRTGVEVLVDLCKAAHLDYLIRGKDVLVDTPKRINALRAAQGLAEKAVVLSPADVTKALYTKSLSLQARERDLSAVLSFLRQETGIPFVVLSEERGKDDPPLVVTLDLTSVTLRELLDRCLHPLGLDWVQGGRAIVVGSTKAIAAQRKAQAQEQEQEQAPKEQAGADKAR